MKGLFAKKQAKMSSKPDYEKKMMMMREKVINSDFEAVTEMDKSKKVINYFLRLDLYICMSKLI